MFIKLALKGTRIKLRENLSAGSAKQNSPGCQLSPAKGDAESCTALPGLAGFCIPTQDFVLLRSLHPGLFCFALPALKTSLSLMRMSCGADLLPFFSQGHSQKTQPTSGFGMLPTSLGRNRTILKRVMWPSVSSVSGCRGSAGEAASDRDLNRNRSRFPSRISSHSRFSMAIPMPKELRSEATISE
jgi:hypothetical protein